MSYKTVGVTSTEEKVHELLTKAEEGVKAVYESDTYRNYLTTMAKFHNYSYRNTLLISMQMPSATRIAGYTSWQTKFHRQVQKGEKGICIIGFTPKEIKVDQQRIKDGKPVVDETGTPITDTLKKVIPRFKPVYVYDVSQTKGEPLPQLVNELTGKVDSYNDLMSALSELSPYPIVFEDIQTGAKGYCSYANKKIAIKSGMSEAQTIKTAIHEITHADLHSPADVLPMEQGPDRGTKEVEAESTAYVVCEHYGIDTFDYTFPYLASWSSSKELNELQNSLDTIQKQAGELISRIDSRLTELQKDRPIQTVIEESIPAEQSAGRLYEIKYDYNNFQQDKLTHELSKYNGEPAVMIKWSENPNLNEGDTFPLHEANSIFRNYDANYPSENGYEKTAFYLKHMQGGELHVYEGRQDFGDKEGSLIDHIKSFWENELTPQAQAQHIAAGNSHLIEDAKTVVNNFIPYLEMHEHLGLLENATQKEITNINILVNQGMDLSANHRLTPYYNAMLDYVQDSRNALNNGTALPELPVREQYLMSHVDHPLTVAIESTDDYSDIDFNASPECIDVMQPKVAAIPDKYRLVCVSTTGIIPVNDKQVIFQSREEAQSYVKAQGFSEIPYDDAIHQAISIRTTLQIENDKAERDVLKEEEYASVKDDNDIDLDRDKTQEQLGYPTASSGCNDPPQKMSMRDQLAAAQKEADIRNEQKQNHHHEKSREKETSISGD